jgi:ADP-heptose:LPS heptosyltransferase
MTITKPWLFDRRRRLWLRSRLVELRALILIAIDTLALPLLRIGLFRRDTGKPSVAVFNLHGAGDLLLSLPCLEQIRGRYPAQQYSVVIYCEPAAAELAALFTPSDQIVVVDRRRLVRSLPYRLFTLRTVAARRHVVAVQPTYNRMLAIEDALVRATGAGERIGSAGSPSFAGPLARRLADRWYHRLAKPSPRSMHELDRFAEFLELLGWPSTACRLPALALPNGSRAISSDYILLLPESSSPLKAWPIDRFEALAHQLADLSEETLVFAGTQAKSGPRRHFRKWRKGQFLDMSGQTSFLDFMHLIKGASLVITNDSVGLHLGAMLGRPVVAVAGGGLPDRYHPYPAWARVQLTVAEMRLPCYGCNWKCIYEIGAGSPAHCVASVEVNQVLAAVREYLGRQPYPTGEVRIELGGAGSAR